VTLGKPHFQVMPWTTISCLPSVTCWHSANREFAECRPSDTRQTTIYA
jgi:hypothetical protein